jgi:hypothetical protein
MDISLTQPEATILAAAISGVLALAAVGTTFLLSRKKTRAETLKAIAETKKLRAELRKPADTLPSGAAQVGEQLLFDGRASVDGFGVKGSAGCIYKGTVPITPEGTGSMQVLSDGVLNIQRTNTDGRYEILLTQYFVGGKTSPLIPADQTLEGHRKLRITCEAKALGGEHTLRFVVRDPVAKRWLGQDTQRITGNSWQPAQAYLSVDPSVDCQIRLDDEAVSAVPSSLQIRNLVVAQRT